MKHLGLFEGIGGFSLAARLIGWHTVAWCEWDAFCQNVLRYHFPEAEAYGDITKTDFTKYAGTIDVLTGGFPCQPYSTAGKRLGTADTRHLWPEMLRAIREVQPRWVVGENVRGLVSWNEGLVFHQVQADLEAEGYEVLPVLLPACAVDAPHRRDRIWFVAYRDGNGFDKRNGKNEIHSGQGGKYAQRDVKSCFDNGPTANPAGDRRKRKGAEAAAEEGFKPGSESGRELEGGLEGLRSNESAADTQVIGQQQSGGTRSGWPGFTNGGGDVNESTADSEQRCEGGMHKTERKKAERHTCTRNARNGGGNWKNFPAQSPVCGGDDGLPRELDGITVSSREGKRTLTKHQAYGRWRKESIKAYGNAVVPQVVLQIFKAIEQYETITP